MAKFRSTYLNHIELVIICLDLNLFWMFVCDSLEKDSHQIINDNQFNSNQIPFSLIGSIYDSNWITDTDWLS